MRVGILLAVGGNALAMQFSGPGLEWKTVWKGCAQVPELAQPDRKRDEFSAAGRSLRGRNWTRGAGRAAVLPDSGEIRLAVHASWDWTGKVRLTVGGFGNSRSRKVGPLRGQYRRQKDCRSNGLDREHPSKYFGNSPVSKAGEQDRLPHFKLRGFRGGGRHSAPHQARKHVRQHVADAIREDELHFLADVFRQITKVLLVAARQDHPFQS
jgi:hypothetical protein